MTRDEKPARPPLVPSSFTRLGETFPRRLQDATDEEFLALLARYAEKVKERGR